MEIGVLEPGAKKTVTEPGRSLARALDHDMPDEIQGGWRDRVEATEFLTQLLTSIRIRKGMTEDTLTSHIAYSAGQPKKSGQMTGARTIIDILRAAGLVREADGKILPLQGNMEVLPYGQARVAIEDVGPSAEEPEISKTHATTIPAECKRVVVSDRPMVCINIEIKVECKPQELDSLGSKLRNILDSIGNIPDQTDSES